ncbi:MAG: hypothetical protein A2Y78_11215 [Acidobacteria bacterium RBG_13_68_16]|nr:MAG: hypothetical protein A2Y78_11215 [Acidobacteria bacterium RBG_13_68_16]
MLILVLALAAAVPPSAPVCVMPEGTRVHLELALSDEEKQLGLMFRDVLPADHGMLFIFDADGPLDFWMKNTFISLDFVWVSAAGEVVDVRAGVPPCRSDPCATYGSGKPARAVLEVNAGFAAAHGVRPGVQLRFENVRGFPVSGGKP